MQMQSILALTQDQVDQAEALLTARLLEYAPDIDKRGAVGRLTLRLHAALAAAEQDLLTRVQQAGTLKAVSLDAASLGAASDVVDAVLDFYRISRGPATKASGSLTVALSRKIDMTVVAGALFSIGSQSYTAASTYQIHSDDAAATSANDLVYRQLAPGVFGFTLTVTAATAGAAGNAPRGSVAVPATTPSGFVSAYAESDISGGADMDDPAALLAKARAGLSARGPSSALAIESALRDVDDLVAVSVVRSGDAEQTRYNSILPIAHGGRVDVYLKSRPLWTESSLTVTATLVERSGSVGVWQATLSRAEAAGLLETRWASRLDKPLARYTIVDDQRGYDLSDLPEQLAPDVTSETQAAYSAVQTAVIQFLDSDTDTTNLLVNQATQDYTLTLRALPSLTAAQTALGGDKIGVVAGDVLVKTPVPCFVGVNFTLVKPSSASPTPNLDTLRAAVAAVVNNSGFGGVLDASSILSRLYPLLLSGQSLRDFDMAGRIRRPDGSYVTARDRQRLEVPDEPTRLVSGKTVAFFLSPDDVGIVVTTP